MCFQPSTIVNDGIGEVLYLSQENLLNTKSIKSTEANAHKNV